MTAKNDVRYWYDRVRKQRSVRADRIFENPFYSVQLQHAGRRMELSLGTANQAEAGAKAKQCYFYLVANGWDAFLAKYRPDKPVSSEKPKARSNLTVGDYLAVVAEQSELSARTLENYAKSFRRIVSDVMKIKGTRKRFDYHNGGRITWLRKIHSTPLADITPEKIRAWKKTFINRAGKNELFRRRYTISANSFCRQARALFGQRTVLAKLSGVELPAVLPFTGVTVERTTSKFYGCGVEPRALLRDALKELTGPERQEQLKAFLLALVLGLRRKEADLVEWSSFDFEAATLRLEPTKWLRLKTQESAALLPIETEFLPLFRTWRAKARTEFVIESETPPRSVTYQWYRCQEVFDCLLAWLRAKGVEGEKPFHSLRKLYGSEMASLHGIHAASGALRHADIRTTDEHYVDNRVTRTAGFGSVLSGASVTEFPKRTFVGRKPRRHAKKN
jgi:integrase